MHRFEGRGAVVTGAASGIGAAVTAALLREGAHVAALDASDKAPATPDALDTPDADARLERFVADVSDEAAVADVLAQVRARTRVDVLVNVAGIGSTTTAPDTSVDVWDRVMAVNARGTFLTCKHLIPAMVEQGSGTIVNVASIAGLTGLPRRAAYCASKGAVIALTRALAADHVADGVRVNCVCPGGVDTAWVDWLAEEADESRERQLAVEPMGRMATPDEIAQAVLYLASDDAGFVTGSALTIDGGVTAWR